MALDDRRASVRCELTATTSCLLPHSKLDSYIDPETGVHDREACREALAKYVAEVKVRALGE